MKTKLTIALLMITLYCSSQVYYEKKSCYYDFCPITGEKLYSIVDNNSPMALAMPSSPFTTLQCHSKESTALVFKSGMYVTPELAEEFQMYMQKHYNKWLNDKKKEYAKSRESIENKRKERKIKELENKIKQMESQIDEIKNPDKYTHILKWDVNQFDSILFLSDTIKYY